MEVVKPALASVSATFHRLLRNLRILALTLAILLSSLRLVSRVRNTSHKFGCGRILGYAHGSTQEASGNRRCRSREIEFDRASAEVGAGHGFARPDRAQLRAGDEQLRRRAEVAHHWRHGRKMAGAVSRVRAGRIVG